MNEQAAKALYEAERRGVKQVTGTLDDGDGGRCALGVLQDHGLIGLALHTRVADTCPLCGEKWLLAELCAETVEFDLIAHLNDDHGLTFSEIARKLGPDAA